MAQVRRQTRYRSPPPQRIPALPNPIRFRPPNQIDFINGLRVDTKNHEQSLLNLNSSSNQFPSLEREQPLTEKNNIVIYLSRNQSEIDFIFF